jgi:sulfur carrier protein ThiS adenylyltransferase
VKRAPKPGSLAFAKAYFARRDRRVLDVLRRSSVGIAGAGGLGSNVAVALARAGVGRLVIADCDRVEPSNLNRQQYFVGQVGERKVAALRENLLAINPFSVYEIHDVRITPRNAARVFARVDVLVEALDKAEAKQMLIEASGPSLPPRGWPAMAATAGSARGGSGTSTSAATSRASVRRGSVRWRPASPWSRPCRPTRRWSSW